MPRLPESRVIVALDYPDPQKVLRVAHELGSGVDAVKIGRMAWDHEGGGHRFVRALHQVSPNSALMLDLKFHDIPFQNAGTVQAILPLHEHGVRWVTAHVGDYGPDHLKACVAHAHGMIGVLAITVLTSVPGDNTVKVVERARWAKEAGCAGVVCSPHEVGAVRKVIGSDMLIVTPGIRDEDAPVDDQMRKASPEQAIAFGSDLLVVGRMITGQEDPIQAHAVLKQRVARACAPV